MALIGTLGGCYSRGCLLPSQGHQKGVTNLEEEYALAVEVAFLLK